MLNCKATLAIHCRCHIDNTVSRKRSVCNKNTFYKQKLSRHCELKTILKVRGMPRLENNREMGIGNFTLSEAVGIKSHVYIITYFKKMHSALFNWPICHDQLLLNKEATLNVRH